MQSEPRIRWVRAGEILSLPVRETIGYMRQSAPDDGFYIETAEDAVFVADTALQEARKQRRRK